MSPAEPPPDGPARRRPPRPKPAVAADPAEAAPRRRPPRPAGTPKAADPRGAPGPARRRRGATAPGIGEAVPAQRPKPGPAKKADGAKPAAAKPVAGRPGPAARPAPTRAGGPPPRRKPIPQAPGPRPDRPARPAPKPRPKATTSTVRFRETPTGSIVAVPIEAKPARPAPAEPARRPSRPDVEELLPAPPSPRTAFRRRYGVVYDTQGPRLRLGVLWALAVVASVAFEPLRPFGMATLYAVVAGVAAMQVVDAWHQVRAGADRWVAALGASTLPVLATQGVRPFGAGLLALVVGAVAVAASRPEREMPLFAAAGHTVLSAGLCGGAAASLVLLADYEILAVAILLTYLMVYDASDYLVGSGASNGIEGPLAGALFMAAVTILFQVLKVAPFRGTDIWSFAVLAAVACPAGQLLASAMLPSASSRAPALRRLDSLLIVAPAWAGLLGLYLQRVGG